MGTRERCPRRAVGDYIFLELLLFHCQKTKKQTLSFIGKTHIWASLAPRTNNFLRKTNSWLPKPIISSGKLICGRHWPPEPIISLGQLVVGSQNQWRPNIGVSHETIGSGCQLFVILRNNQRKQKHKQH